MAGFPQFPNVERMDELATPMPAPAPARLVRESGPAAFGCRSGCCPGEQALPVLLNPQQDAFGQHQPQRRVADRRKAIANPFGRANVSPWPQEDRATWTGQRALIP
ncbi:hypothetical protein E6O75_ATG08571 [Venturia nashicola]|uniref:Uncharacterized protein n=1 Tax=Venturia nashicola TaxID=86259 RepID=A0A4Z1P3W1_9PEZI|nr:hypothetical protein E6O75_ATG08571 [Venturia nashicola]